MKVSRNYIKKKRPIFVRNQIAQEVVVSAPEVQLKKLLVQDRKGYKKNLKMLVEKLGDLLGMIKLKVPEKWI